MDDALVKDDVPEPGVAGTPEKGAVIARARDLVRFARQQGYRRDELIRLIEEIA